MERCYTRRSQYNIFFQWGKLYLLKRSHCTILFKIIALFFFCSPQQVHVVFFKKSFFFFTTSLWCIFTTRTWSILSQRSQCLLLKESRYLLFKKLHHLFFLPFKKGHVVFFAKWACCLFFLKRSQCLSAKKVTMFFPIRSCCHNEWKKNGKICCLFFKKVTLSYLKLLRFFFTKSFIIFFLHKDMLTLSKRVKSSFFQICSLHCLLQNGHFFF